MKFYFGVSITIWFQNCLSSDYGKEVRYIAEFFAEEESDWLVKGDGFKLALLYSNSKDTLGQEDHG